METKDEKVKLSKLFTTSFLISLFIIGSGHVVFPIYRKKFVEDNKWLDEQEMMDIMVISQCSPGAIAVNMAVALGYRMAGFLGALSMVLGTLLPPLFLLTIVQFFYSSFVGNPILTAIFRGMNATVSAILINVVLSMLGDIKQQRVISYILMVTSFILVYFLKIYVAYVILAGIVIACLLSLRLKR